MNGIEVRRVSAGDWREMKRVRLAALATDRLAFGSTLAAESAFGDDVWVDRATWVAVAADGRMVGMMGAHIEGLVAKLFGSWVDPAARGAGVGGRLLDAVVGWVEAAHPEMPIALSVNPAFAA